MNERALSLDDMLGATLDVWTLERLIARGPFHAVFYGRPTAERLAPAVIKVVEPPIEHPQVLARLRAEVAALRRIHPAENIIGFLAAAVDARPFPWLALEWIDGTRLEDELKDYRALSLPRVLELATGMLRGLIALHRHGVVHRDLKPRNVWLSVRGELRLSDLSLVHLPGDFPESGTTAAGDVVGSPRFMAPEQCRGDSIDSKADLYAFGVLLFRMLTGRNPFEGESAVELLEAHIGAEAPPVSSLLPNVPPRIDVLVGRLLAKDPSHRPDAATCLEVIAQIRASGPNADPATEPEEQDTDTVHPVALELRPGDVLDGYIVEQELGRGGMGITYACRAGSGSRFALKVAGFKFKSAERAREQMRRDAEHAAQIPDHPAIAKVHGFGETQVRGVPVFYLCCELVMGPSLSRLVDRYGPLPPRALRHLWVSVIEGLETIHQAGILHLDLKPGNILLDRHMDAERPLEPQLLEALPKIIDFGISRRADDAPDTTTGLEGTPYYMSPEQCEGLTSGPTSDIYTLGSTFFHLATGAPPFAGEQLAVIHQQVTSAPPIAELEGRLGHHLSLILSRCLLKDPQERFASAAELLDYLSQAGEREFPRRELEYLRDREHLVLSGKAPRRAPPSSGHKHLRMRSEAFEQLGQLLSAVGQLEPTQRELDRTTTWLEQHLEELREILLDEPGRATMELEVVFKVLIPRIESTCAKFEGERASILERLQALTADSQVLVGICELRARTLTEEWRAASAALARLNPLEETRAQSRLVRVRVERDLEQRIAELRWDLRESKAKIDGLLANGRGDWAAQELLSFERRHPQADEVEDVGAELEALRERVAQGEDGGPREPSAHPSS